MILEGIVTTLNEDGTANISPMGPEVDASMAHVVLKPFRSSRTYHNLRRHGEGVFHVTDDVHLMARAAVNRFDRQPSQVPAESVDGVILADACRWYAFRVSNLDDSNERTRIECNVLDHGRNRDFFGFNRGKHAVVEAAILATRVAFLPHDQVRGEFSRLATLVEKTGGDQEHQAFRILNDYVDEAISNGSRDRKQPPHGRSTRGNTRPA